MDIEGMKKLVDRYDEKKTIDCQKLIKYLSEISNKPRTVCCRCKGSLTRGIRELKNYLRNV